MEGIEPLDECNASVRVDKRTKRMIRKSGRVRYRRVIDVRS
jgi:hypothetical protein